MNRKLHRWAFVWIAMLAMLLSFASCSKLQDLLNSDDDDDWDDNTTEVVEGTMEVLSLSGLVKDADGNPIEGVSVVTGTSTATTNSVGFFEFSSVNTVQGRSVVRFSKDGYFDIVRSLGAADGESWEVVMCKKVNNDFTTLKSYESSASQTLQVGGMKIEMPGDGYKMNESGENYTGKVKAEMVYLNPNNERFSEMMPGGDLTAVDKSQSRVILLSYGMTDLNMYSGTGEKLQLKKGCKAKLTFPVPEGMGEGLPSSIPLWSFNEQTGLWDEEGSATLQGSVYVGEVSHFSWVNLDYPEKQASVWGYVKDKAGKPLSGVRLSIGQLLSPTKTDSEGYYSQVVPAKTNFCIMVEAKYYGGDGQMAFVSVAALDPRESRQVDVVLDRLVRVYGDVVDGLDKGLRASVWVEANGWKTEAVTTDKEGNFDVYLSENQRGKATIHARTADGRETTEDVTIEEENIYKKLRIGNGGDTGLNMIYIYSDAMDDAMWPVIYSSPLSGVFIIDKDLILTSPDGYDYESVPVSLQIHVPDYDVEKTEYDNGVVVDVANPSVGKSFYSLDGKEMKCTVLRDGKTFTFDVSGYGTYEDKQTGEYDENAKVKGSNMRYNLVMEGKILRNIKPLDEGFPSFTPQLETKAPLAVQIIESVSLGNGGFIYYNGGVNDYLTLKAAASKQGFTLLGEDNEDGYRDVIYYSAKKKALIDIEFDSEAPGVTDEITLGEAGGNAPIYMMIFEGIDQNMLEAMFEAGDTRSRVVKSNSVAKVSKSLHHLMKSQTKEIRKLLVSAKHDNPIRIH